MQNFLFLLKPLLEKKSLKYPFIITSPINGHIKAMTRYRYDTSCINATLEAAPLASRRLRGMVVCLIK